jgi:hypothetical protein
MKNRWQDMEYNDFLNCWEVYWAEGTRRYSVRCGESFKLYLGNEMELSCRMELGMDWYIIFGQNDTKLYLKPNETYKVDI